MFFQTVRLCDIIAPFHLLLQKLKLKTLCSSSNIEWSRIKKMEIWYIINKMPINYLKRAFKRISEVEENARGVVCYYLKTLLPSHPSSSETVSGGALTDLVHLWMCCGASERLSKSSTDTKHGPPGVPPELVLSQKHYDLFPDPQFITW